MPIELYPSVAKVKRNGVYQNLPGFIPETGDMALASAIAITESTSTAQFLHPVNSYFFLNGTLYQADENIDVNETISVGDNCHVAVLGDEVTELMDARDNAIEKEYGVLFFDIMGIGTVSILNRIFNVDKNRVTITSSGNSSTYRCVNLFGEIHTISSTWADADLSSETFYNIDFPTDKYNLILTYNWENFYYPNNRNILCIATKNPETGVISKTNLAIDGLFKNADQDIFRALPEIRDNKNFALFLENRNSNYPNVLTYEFSIQKVAGDSLLYKGTPVANELIFNADYIKAGDIVYYDFELTAEGNVSGYIELLNSSNTRVGLIGKIASATGGTKFSGAFKVPEGFHHAVYKSSGTVTTKINYITTDMPPKYADNLINPIDYRGDYTQSGSGLRTTGTITTSSGTSLMGITDYIPVIEGDLITINEFLGSNTYGLCFYDLKCTYISGLPTKVDTMSIIVPTGISYIRYTVNKNQTQVINIFRGDELKVKCGNLYKKKAVTFGDSITWYDGNQFTWGKYEGKFAVGYQSYMRRVGMVVTNEGVSGYDITEINTVIKTKTFTDYDYATITSGANDTKDSIPVGSIADIGSTFDTTTFYGALQDSIEYILGQKDTIKIVLMTPIKGTVYPDTDIDPLYVKAIKDIGALYGLPVCDWYNESGINKLTYGPYINDPDENNNLYWFHPTNLGFKRMADILVPFLKNLEVETIPHAFP